MTLSSDVLLDVIAEASYRLHTMIKAANREDRLEQLLVDIGMSDLVPISQSSELYETDPNGKILIAGGTKLKVREIFGLLKVYGVNKERIELVLEYDVLKSYDFRKIQYNPNYRLLIFGPIPHSGVSKEASSSIISSVESLDGYPKIIRLTDAHGLKITKSNLSHCIKSEIDKGYLAV